MGRHRARGGLPGRQALPVLHLRETATKMDLLRKHRGMLQLTAAGRKLRTVGHP
jgi:hypothetical protein